MKAVDLNKLEVGTKVRTKWDDDPQFANGVVAKRYRGHRCNAYIVKFPDGTTEMVQQDQIVKVLK